MNAPQAIDHRLGPIEVCPLTSTDQFAGGEAAMSRRLQILSTSLTSLARLLS